MITTLTGQNSPLGPHTTINNLHQVLYFLLLSTQDLPQGYDHYNPVSRRCLLNNARTVTLTRPNVQKHSANYFPEIF